MVCAVVCAVAQKGEQGFALRTVALDNIQRQIKIIYQVCDLAVQCTLDAQSAWLHTAKLLSSSLHQTLTRSPCPADELSMTGCHAALHTL